MSPWRAAAYGGLVVGAADAIDALVFFGSRGLSPVRLFQGIAGGLLGRAAFRGGLSTVVLGVFLQFFIAFAIVSIYVAASRWIAVLTRHPVICGILYGVLAFLVMNYVVVPLSAAVRSPKVNSVPNLVNGFIGHALLIGVPSALFARAADPAT